MNNITAKSNGSTTTSRRFSGALWTNTKIFIRCTQRCFFPVRYGNTLQNDHEAIRSHAKLSSPKFTLDLSARCNVTRWQTDSEDYAHHHYVTMKKGTTPLRHAHDGYKRDFYARLRRTRTINAGDSALLDVIDSEKKTDKSFQNVGRLLKILDIKGRTAVIQRGDLTERLLRDA